MDKPEINVVWLKRNLRLQDNEALFRATQANIPFLIVYLFEPFLLNDPHYESRHWNFIRESLRDLNEALRPHRSKVLSVQSEVIPFFNKLQSYYRIQNIYSHQETGIKVTYERDKNFTRYCRNNQIQWQEFVNNGVFRGLINRQNWKEDWESYMKEECFAFTPKAGQILGLPSIQLIEVGYSGASLETPEESPFQKGGTRTALQYLRSFLETRYPNYNSDISKPEVSRKSCSRLSPYLAWGNLSVREVWQEAKALRNNSSHKRALDGFTSRLRWQAHFIQKFEMEETMEQESVNKGYGTLKKAISRTYLRAWETGNTGFPLVDACMRCLKETGYLNFRMRAMVVSFATHHLWQPWQAISKHLSRCFLDFEPGIHFPQLQMQAGETGINQIRIYSPVKNSYEHDPYGVFIRRWVPELRSIPDAFVHEPYLMTELDQKFANFTLGKDYPRPVIDLEVSRKKASQTLWDYRKHRVVKEENRRILQKHTLKDKRPFDS
ncbi:cryptochrome/deoxyribodipyrimidine photo-lyase family protein [Lentiprolixibacter aurantiacus]|uniref:Deoxyribodipyrimidine photo-lyase n=1 Tax=Lentiprolixibacter aurantiacus TaxID=2993939 RepID=A0AAE3SNW4_9FLAO|nr:FAD-binding domain-containing protein [Lentiprolixibacter aurantiacus]MCX2718892.1 deoxyribodipyrimidine photo-lyase [Lentiprolixibacter aurantiacus]